jgi:hypothetical protein
MSPFDERAAERAIAEIKTRTQSLPPSDLDAAAELLAVAEWLKSAEKAMSAPRAYHELVVKAGGTAAEGILEAPKVCVLASSFELAPLVDVDRIRNAFTAASSTAEPELDRIVQSWGNVQKGLSAYLDAAKRVEASVQSKVSAVQLVVQGEDAARKMRETRSGFVGTNLSGLYQGGVGGRGGWPSEQSLGWLEESAKKEKDQDALAFVARIRKSLEQVRAACSEGKAAVGFLRAALTPDAGVVRNWDPQQLRACKEGLDMLSERFFHYENWGSGQIAPAWSSAILVRREDSSRVVEAVAKMTSQVSVMKQEIAKYRSQGDAQIAKCRQAAAAWSKVWEATRDFSGMVDERKYLTLSPPAAPQEPPSPPGSVRKSARSYRIEGENYYCTDGGKSLLLKVPAKFAAVFVRSRSREQPNEARVSGRFTFVGNGQGTNAFGGPVTVEIWAADAAWADAMLSHVKAIEDYERKQEEFEARKSAQIQAWTASNAKVINSCRRMTPPRTSAQLAEYLDSLKALKEAEK